jgi:hypothetical protein
MRSVIYEVIYHDTKCHVTINTIFNVVWDLLLIVFGQFWADFATLAVADSMPKLWLKSLKPYNFWTMSPNVTYSVSLESCNPYLQPQKVSKFYCIHCSLPKSPKSYFGFHHPLGRAKARLGYHFLDILIKWILSKTSKVYQFCPF